MANWCNARLIVFGTHSDVKRFESAAKRRRAAMFLPDMWIGESGELSSDGVRRRDGRYEKSYYFQIRNDDGRSHFTEVSTHWPALAFILAYATSDFAEIGAFRIARGESRHYVVGRRRWRAIYQTHGCVVDPADEDEDENDFNFHLASLDAMDVAEVHWRKRLRMASAPRSVTQRAASSVRAR